MVTFRGMAVAVAGAVVALLAVAAGIVLIANRATIPEVLPTTPCTAADVAAPTCVSSIEAARPGRPVPIPPEVYQPEGDESAGYDSDEPVAIR